MINNFIYSHGLSVITQITSGNRCKNIYRVKDFSGNSFILKIAGDNEGLEEIRRNLEGYKKLKLLKLSYFIPEIFSSSFEDEKAHILMEDCGVDLATHLKNSRLVFKSYDHFEEKLFKVYNESLGVGIDANKYIDFYIQTAKKLYDDFFKDDFGFFELNDAMEKLHELLPQHMEKFCFSSWDFMPGNIFYDTIGLKFIDPTELVTGVPIIDLACLGGVLGDIYNYPGVQELYKSLKKFSLGPVAEMLCLTKQEAQQIYLLGRLTQTLLHLRALIQQYHINNIIFINRIEDYIKQLLFIKR